LGITAVHGGGMTLSESTKFSPSYIIRGGKHLCFTGLKIVTSLSKKYRLLIIIPVILAFAIVISLLNSKYIILSSNEIKNITIVETWRTESKPYELTQDEIENFIKKFNSLNVKKKKNYKYPKKKEVAGGGTLITITKNDGSKNHIMYSNPEILCFDNSAKTNEKGDLIIGRAGLLSSDNAEELENFIQIILNSARYRTNDDT
jgi:hypothetical protein